MDQLVLDFSKRKGIKMARIAGARNPIEDQLKNAGVKESKALIKPNAGDQVRIQMRVMKDEETKN